MAVSASKSAEFPLLLLSNTDIIQSACSLLSVPYNRLTSTIYRPPLTNFADFQSTFKHIDQQLDSLMENALSKGATNHLFVKLFQVERKAAYIYDLVRAMKKFDTPWPQYLIPQKELHMVESKYKISAIPLVIFFDHEGNVVKRFDDGNHTHYGDFIERYLNRTIAVSSSSSNKNVPYLEEMNFR